MPKKNLQYPDDDKFDSFVVEALKVSESEIDDAWELYANAHIKPSRAIQIASESSCLSEAELCHLHDCECCRGQIESYGLTELPKSVRPENSVSNGYASTTTNGVVRSEHRITFDSDQAVPAVLRECFHIEGPTVFPDNHVALSSWQFGLLSQLEQDGNAFSREAMQLVCDKALSTIRSQIKADLSKAVFVCFGRAMHEIGINLAASVCDSNDSAPHVVLAHDYFSPKLVCDPNEFHAADVVVLTDVIHSGSLLKRIMLVCQEYSPSRVTGLAIIDQCNESLGETEYYSLWKSKCEERITLENFHDTPYDNRTLRFFDPNAACALEHNNVVETHLPSPRYDLVDTELQKCIQLTGAMKKDFTIGKKRYPFAVNVLDLIKKNEESRKYIISKAVAALADCTFQNTCLAYHAGRSRRAGVIANAIGDVTGWPSFSMGTRGKTFSLTDDQCKRFAAFDNVVIVDAAIRTGETFSAIAQAVTQERLSLKPRILGMCIFNALACSDLAELSEYLGVELRAAFSLPLAPPTEEVRHWAAAQKTVIGRQLLEQPHSDTVREILIDYCMKPSGRCISSHPLSVEETTNLVHEAVTHATRVEAGTEHITAACVTRSPKPIRHLSVNDVIHDEKTQQLLTGIMFNSMKPHLKESAAIALAAADKYEWMSLKWLKCNEPFLSAKSPAWKSVVLIERYLRLQDRERELNTFRAAAQEYRSLFEERRKQTIRKRPRQLGLFGSLVDHTATAKKSNSDRVLERVDAFIQAAE